MVESLPSNVLLYTTAFDTTGTLARRTMAKMLVSSLLRSYFTGRIVIFRNTETPLFKVAKAGVEEIYIDTSDCGDQLPEPFSEIIQNDLDTEGTSVVTYVDAASAVRRSIDHLFAVDRPWKLLWFSDQVWAVKTEFFPDFIFEWRTLAEGNAADGTKNTKESVVVCPDTDYPSAWPRRLPFERDEVHSVSTAADTSYLDWREAAILSTATWPPDAQLEFLTGVFYARYFGDQTGHFLDILEP
jgi:hypothetical protein